MKAIVHIGAPKTGTSSLQQFLQLNRGALAKLGLRYDRNIETRGSQFEYPMVALMQAGELPGSAADRVRYRCTDAAMQRANYGHAETALAQFVRKFDEPWAVFSTEHALPWLKTPELIARFDALFTAAFDEVRYIVYLRDQRELVLSQYSEQLKRANPAALEDFVTQRLAGLNFYKTLRRWVDTVGRDRLQVRLHDCDTLLGGDVITDFCAACGIDDSGMTRPTRQNEKLTAIGAAALRVLNTRIPELRNDGAENPLRAGLVARVMHHTRDGAPLGLPAAQARAVADAVAESNEKLRRTFFPKRAVLFPGARATPAPDPAYLNDAATQALAEIIIDLRLGAFDTLGPLKRRRAVLTGRGGAAAPTRASA